MFTFITVLHVLVALILIVIVLLQTGKGASMGAVFGGGSSNTLFGNRGAGNFLTKMTTVSAVLFMITSFTISMFSSKKDVTTITPPDKKIPITGEPATTPEEESKNPASQLAVPAKEKKEVAKTLDSGEKSSINKTEAKKSADPVKDTPSPKEEKTTPVENKK